MVNSELSKKVTAIVEPIAKLFGYEVWGVEIKFGPRTLLRIFLDSESGVSLDDCARVSGQVSGVLDVENLMSGGYDLEVSSPGLDRVLFKDEHFQRFVGCDISLKLRMPLDGRRNFKGKIVNVSEDGKITLMVDKVSQTFNIADIIAARLVPEY